MCPFWFSFVHISLFASIHCKELLVWFKDSGFWNIVSAWPPLELHLVILLLPYAIEILKLWVCRTWFFTGFSRSDMGWILGWAIHNPVSEPGILNCTLKIKLYPYLNLAHTHHQQKFSLCQRNTSTENNNWSKCTQLIVSYPMSTFTT